MLTEAQDIHRADGVARAGGPALGAAIYTAVLAPLPAYGTRLRGKGFAEGDGPNRFVGELADDLAGTGATHLLGLHAPDELGGVVKWLAHVAGGVRKGLGYLACGLVAQVADAPLGLVEHTALAPLQPLVAAQTVGLACLRLLDSGELLIAVLHRGLGGASTDENDLRAVGGRDEGVHPQVYPDDSLLVARLIRHFADHAHHAIGQADLHDAPWQRDRFWQADTQRPALAMWQHEPPVTDTRILIGVHHVVIAAQAPGIARLRVAVLPQLAARVHRLRELADDLLGRLRRETWIALFRPALPARLAGPRPIEAADAVMPPYEIIPQPRRFLAAGRKGCPFGCGAWCPRNFYRAIAHRPNVPNRRASVKRGAWPRKGHRAFIPMPEDRDAQPVSSGSVAE
jgi:hypothetical protein